MTRDKLVGGMAIVVAFIIAIYSTGGDLALGPGNPPNVGYFVCAVAIGLWGFGFFLQGMKRYGYFLVSALIMAVLNLIAGRIVMASLANGLAIVYLVEIIARLPRRANAHRS